MQGLFLVHNIFSLTELFEYKTNFAIIGPAIKQLYQFQIVDFTLGFAVKYFEIN